MGKLIVHNNIMILDNCYLICGLRNVKGILSINMLAHILKAFKNRYVIRRPEVRVL